MPYHPALDRASESQAGRSPHRHHRQGRGPGLRGQGGAHRASAWPTCSTSASSARSSRSTSPQKNRAPARDLRRADLHRRGDPRPLPALRGLARARTSPTPRCCCTAGSRRAPPSCSRARRAPCSTSTTGRIRSSPRRAPPRAAPPPAPGVPPTKIDGVLGISKAYCTRVGGGPVPDRGDGRDGRHAPRPRQRVRRGDRAGRAAAAGPTRSALRYAVAHQRPRHHRADQARRARQAARRCRSAWATGTGARCSPTSPRRSGIWHEAEPVYEELSGWQTSTARHARLRGAAVEGARVPRAAGGADRRAVLARLHRGRCATRRSW